MSVRRTPNFTEPEDREHQGLRTLDDHASWKEVAYACHVSGGYNDDRAGD